MATFRNVLVADLAGPQFQKAHEYAGYVLAASTPLAIISKKDGWLQRLADLGFAFAIPVHMHMGLNACVTDYLPKAARNPVRYGLLGATAITFIGLVKINIAGPGITQTVKGMWHRPPKTPPAAPKQ